MEKSNMGWSFWESSLIIFTMPMAVGPFRAATTAVPRSAVSTSEAELAEPASLSAEETSLGSELTWEEALPSEVTVEELLSELAVELTASLEEPPSWEQANRVRHRHSARVRDRIRFIGFLPFCPRSCLPGRRAAPRAQLLLLA